MLLSKFKGDIALFVGLGIMVFSLGGLAYVYGVHETLKKQHKALTEQNLALTKEVTNLKAEKKIILDANLENQSTINTLTADLLRSQKLINNTASRNRELQSTITSLRIEQAKGTQDDGEISPILLETLKSIPGATK